MYSAYIRKSLRLLAAATLAAGLAGSCAETPEFDLREEGRAATVRLHWSPSEMKIQSRALDDAQERSVHSLWIGIYDYKSGALKRISTDDGTTHHDRGYYITPDATLEHHKLDPEQALQFHTTSGESRIVAVANPDTNYGLSTLVESSATSTLLDLLGQCDTWEKFCSVAALTGAVSSDGETTPNITLTESNMPMAGVYYETLNHDTSASDPTDWTADATNRVYIPAGATTLPGTIHLRRLHAHIDFRIVPGRYITVEPISWQVHNIPYVSYLQERERQAPEGCNAGDADALGRKLGGDDYRGNYASSRLAYTFDKADKLGAAGDRSGFTFDFYQFENKHTGLDRVTTYSDRESEHKTGEGANTGVYSSLVDDAAGGKNNMASFVELQAKVSYYIDAEGNIVDPDDADVADKATPRLGFATYVVHLGYCEGEDEAAKARDFNCRRNTRYTYTVEINGLDKIRVEAQEGDEPAPGAEGDVIDYNYNSFIDLDCHYAVFNIRMSDNDRRNLYWRLRAPYGDSEGTRIRSYDQTTEDRDDPFYNWIRFKPTGGEHVLARYREAGITDAEADAALWTLHDMQDVDGHPHTATTGGSDTERWYTVFVDEYAYLLDRGGARLAATKWEESAWERYVNLPDRTVWLIVDDDNYHISPDKESLYTRTKYMISQRSIQTYYSTEHLNQTRTALGIEHMNETFGKNLVWNWKMGNYYDTVNDNERNDDLSHSNGRWNTWEYISTQNNQWDKILDQTRPDGVYPVQALQSTSSYPLTGHPMEESPAPTGTYYEIITACMSRNRDLNGNGTIDANELKWYLPAEGKYERIMLGRNALKSWLFDPQNAPHYTISHDPYALNEVVPALSTPLRYLDDVYGIDGRPCWVHYASSDHRKFYPDEGGSYNNSLSCTWAPPGRTYGQWPWNIRCIRNLGTTVETVTTNSEDDPVERAYTFEARPTADRKTVGGIFDASSYDDNCLRGNIGTYLPVHTVSDIDRNLIARTFEVAGTDESYTIPEGKTMEELMDDNIPCAAHRDYDGDPGGWRIPNQREIMMILTESQDRAKNGRIPILPEDGILRFSCTKEAYGRQVRFSVIKTTTYMTDPVGEKGRFTVRCVRDVNPARQGR